MTQPDIIQTILKDSDYHLTLFTEDEINALCNKTAIKIVGDKYSEKDCIRVVDIILLSQNAAILTAVPPCTRHFKKPKTVLPNNGT